MKRKTTIFILMLCTAFAFGQENAIWNKVQKAQRAGIQFEQSKLFSWKAEIPEVQQQVVTEGAILSLNNDAVRDILSEQHDALTMQIPISETQSLAINLIRNDKLITSDFTVITSSSNGESVNVESGVYYQGVISGESNSWVALSVFNNEVMAVVNSPIYGEMNLGKVENSLNGDHVFFTSRSWQIPMEFSCGNESNSDFTLPQPQWPEAYNPNNCVRIYFECEYNMYQDNGSSVQNTINQMTGIYNVVKLLYDNESINTSISQIFVWDTPDPFATGPNTSDALVSFRNYRTSFNGDLAHLVSRGSPAGGGVAWINGLCNSYGYAYSYIYSSYSQFPTYSWTTNVITHEMGHNLGSRHTHDCAWDVDGNGTAAEAIDGCGPAAGYSSGSCSNGPIPNNGGTIMSYCHLVSGVGINLSNGFGPLPGNLIRNNVYNASCLSPCTTVDVCANPVSSFPYAESFESSFGGWTNSGGDDTDWTRRTGSTPSSNTGPSAAADGSYYVYIEASSPNYPGKTANLNSDCLDFSNLTNPSLDFSYHMYGTSMGTLNVQASTDNGSSWSTVWTKSGDQGNTWIAQSVSLSTYAGESSIIIRLSGTTGSSWSSDICIDDASIQDGSNADTQAPTAPTNLSASGTTTSSTDLSWTASTDNVGVTGYNVFVDGTFDGTTASTNYTVSGLTPSTTYDFYITANDAAGNTSGASNTVTETTLSPGGGSSVLLGSYFETGWDGWQDGGNDCSRYSGSRSWEGSYSILIRDNSGVSSSMTSPTLDLTGYNQIDIEFYFYPNSMENNEDFWLRYYDGNSWTTVATWARGSSFNNNTFYTATVTLNSSSYTFPSNAQIRFQCDASGNNDRIYIDAVTVTASNSSIANMPSGPITSIKEVGSNNGLDITAVEDGAIIYPNPASGVISILSEDQPEKVTLISMAGQVVLQINDTEDLSDIDVSHLPVGSYIVSLQFEDEIEYIKLVKQ